ncbi:MAG TPA: hypothetical protein VKY51_07610 [Fredinandcohnia sp.]|nr:hypothetical protein [Fredinandcohnia sp.]
MTVRGWLGALVVAGLVGSSPAAAETRPVERVSEWEPTATEAWRESGFRIQLRVGLETLSDVTTTVARGLSQGGALAFGVEPGIRLGRWFSISGTLKYSAVAGAALRWTNTLDLTLHPFHGFFLAGGFGYGGLMHSDCNGGGLVLVARAGWLIPLGQVFSTGPVAQVDAQSPIACDFGATTGRFTSRTLSWSFAWR